MNQSVKFFMAFCWFALATAVPKARLEFRSDLESTCKISENIVEGSGDDCEITSAVGGEKTTKVGYILGKFESLEEGSLNVRDSYHIETISASTEGSNYPYLMLISPMVITAEGAKFKLTLDVEAYDSGMTATTSYTPVPRPKLMKTESGSFAEYRVLVPQDHYLTVYFRDVKLREGETLMGSELPVNAPIIEGEESKIKLFNGPRTLTFKDSINHGFITNEPIRLFFFKKEGGEEFAEEWDVLTMADQPVE